MPVLLDDLRRVPVAGDLCEISARVRRPDAGEMRLWWRFPEAFAPAWRDGSPFVAAARVWALQHDQELVTDLPVSPALAANLKHIHEGYGSRVLQRTRPMAQPPPVAAPPPGHPVTGCFFGLGVDSWHAALTALADDPQEPPLTHLIFSPDFVSDVWPREVVAAHARAAREAGSRMGCGVIEVQTNLRRDLASQHNRLNLASTALALGLSRTLIPSNRGPAGQHATFDLRLSTERSQLLHYGAATRLQKVARIAGSATALSSLYVCGTKKLTDLGNCGRCEKCMRTMLALHVAGALDECPTFETDLLPALARVRQPLGHRAQWRQTLSALGASEQDRRVAAAIRLALAQHDIARMADDLRALAGDPALHEVEQRLPDATERAAALLANAHKAIHPPRRAGRSRHRPWRSSAR